MLPLINIIRKHSIYFHCSADDTQWLVVPEPTDQLLKLQTCLEDIKGGMSRNFLQLKSDENEVITLGPKHLRNLFSCDVALLSGINPPPSTIVRNLGVLFNQDLSLGTHVNYVSRTAFYHLHNIVKMRNLLSQTVAERLVHALISSRLDDCNSLLSGCLKKLLNSLQNPECRC